MDFDEMLEVWRAQDHRPPYRVNHELLRVVVQQEHAVLRRESGWDLWFVPFALWAAAGAMLVVYFALLFAATMRGWLVPNVWDYVAAGVVVGVMLVWPVAYWLSYRRQAARERSFGNSLQDEIRRNLSRVDHHLAQYGRFGPSLMMRMPFVVVALLFIWGTVRMDEMRVTLFIVAFGMLSPLVWTGGYMKKQLLEHRRRLSQLLDLLDTKE